MHKSLVSKNNSLFLLPSSECLQEIQQRYDECDSQGHISPDPKTGYCSHCFRRLNYDFPEIRDLLVSRQSLPLDLQPCDAPTINREMQSEIALSKMVDLFNGLLKLRDPNVSDYLRFQ